MKEIEGFISFGTLSSEEHCGKRSFINVSYVVFNCDLFFDVDLLLETENPYPDMDAKLNLSSRVLY